MSPEHADVLGKVGGGAADWITYRERGTTVMLRAMVFLSSRLGRRSSRFFLYLIVFYFYLFAPTVRRHSQVYLRRALGREPHAIDRLRHLLTFATTIHDRIYLLNDQFNYFSISTEGEQLVKDNCASGRGALLMGAHVGSFEVIRSVSRLQPGLRVSMAMFEDNARKINAMLRAINPSAMVEIIALGHLEAMLDIRDRLEQGALVGMLADRSLGDQPCQSVRFLGALAPLPVGPMRIAALLRRPVIFMLGLYRGDNRYHVVFAPLADFSATPANEREAAVRAAIARYAELLQQYCHSDPYNWFNFFDFWRGASCEPAPGPE
jgi:predicted LPLAT superfamily acyltransferase